MENENLTEQENMDINQSDAAQSNVGNPIAGGIVSQMAVQENVTMSGAEELAGDRSPDAESGEAAAQAGSADSETISGSEPEK